MKRLMVDLLERIGVDPPEWLEDRIVRTTDRHARLMDNHLEDVYDTARGMIIDYRSHIHAAAASIAAGRILELQISYAAHYLRAETSEDRASYARPDHFVMSFTRFCAESDAILLSFDDIDFLFENPILSEEERQEIKLSALEYTSEQIHTPGLPHLRITQAPNSRDTILVFDL